MTNEQVKRYYYRFCRWQLSGPHYVNCHQDSVQTVLVIIYMYMTYRQLFGYGWWSTLWRFAVVVLTQAAVMVLAIVIVIYFFVYDDESKADADLIKAFLFILAVTVAFVAVMLLVTHFINKRTFNKYRTL